MLSNKRLLALFAVTSLAIIALWFWHYRSPNDYLLTVVNNSDQLVDQVSVFGNGTVEVTSVNELPPGMLAQLTVELKKNGELRIGVLQGLNRIDTLIAKDVGLMTSFTQGLDIQQNNRYLLHDD